jgi:predicted phage tail component-like protein
MAYTFHDGFTFGGVTSSSLSLMVIDKEIPLMPEIEEQTEETPGIDGAYDFGVRYKPKIIPVKVRVLGATNKADYMSKLRNIAAVLNPRLGSKELIFDDEPDKMYFARLSETFSPTRLGLISDEFTLNFICYDPFTYSVAEKDLSGTSEIVANNAGSHVAKPTLIITKGAGAAVIRCTHPDQTTEEIAFSSNSPAGVYTINSKEQTSLLDSEGAYEYLDEEKYFTLQNGDNTISVVSGSISNIRVIYRDTWL